MPRGTIIQIGIEGFWFRAIRVAGRSMPTHKITSPPPAHLSSRVVSRQKLCFGVREGHH
jgi:hypothetical protein